jgi:hypothetical protein
MQTMSKKYMYLVRTIFIFAQVFVSVHVVRAVFIGKWTKLDIAWLLVHSYQRIGFQCPANN